MYQYFKSILAHNGWNLIRKWLFIHGFSQSTEMNSCLGLTDETTVLEGLFPFMQVKQHEGGQALALGIHEWSCLTQCQHKLLTLNFYLLACGASLIPHLPWPWRIFITVGKNTWDIYPGKLNRVICIWIWGEKWYIYLFFHHRFDNF